jgi:thiol:disulfide interchange protein
MKKNFKFLFVIFIVAVALSVVIRPGSGGGKELVHWRNDLTAAREEARTAHKPLFVEFTASWCGYCQQMAQTTWADKAVAAELEKMVPVQIDVDSHPDIAQQYGIKPIPAYIVLDSAGSTLKSGEGYKSPAEFIAWLNGKTDGP